MLGTRTEVIRGLVAQGILTPDLCTAFEELKRF